MNEMNYMDFDGFPNMDNIDVFKTETNFNYSLWGAKTNIKLCNVQWDSEYEHVVKFNNDAERDSYFNEIESYSTTLNTAFRIPPDGDIKLSIPYDEVINYNYLVASYPQAPVPGVTSKSRLKYFYFIKDMKYVAPNTTLVVLQLDIWTTFINDVNINNMMLERGHSPMTLTTPDEFLSDPINNTKGLLTQDITVDEAGNVVYEKFVPFNVNKQYFVMAINTNINGDFNLNIPEPSYNISNHTPHNISLIAIDIDDMTSFLRKVNSDLPHFMHSIEACYILDESFFNIYETKVFLDTYVHIIYRKNLHIPGYKLNRSHFNYDEKYDRITKLYTSPYCFLEVTDNNGKTAKIRIQDISTNQIDIKSFTSILYPFLNIKAFLTNIGGTGINEYQVEKLSEDKMVSMGIDDWHNYIFDMDIPTYALYQKAETEYLYKNQFNIEQKIKDINHNYNMTDQNIENTKTNADLSASVTSTNTAEQNELQKTIGNRNNLNTKTNANLSTQTVSLNSSDAIENTKLVSIANNSTMTEQKDESKNHAENIRDINKEAYGTSAKMTMYMNNQNFKQDRFLHWAKKNNLLINLWPLLEITALGEDNVSIVGSSIAAGAGIATGTPAGVISGIGFLTNSLISQGVNDESLKFYYNIEKFSQEQAELPEGLLLSDIESQSFDDLVKDQYGTGDDYKGFQSFKVTMQNFMTGLQQQHAKKQLDLNTVESNRHLDEADDIRSENTTNIINMNYNTDENIRIRNLNTSNTVNNNNFNTESTNISEKYTQSETIRLRNLNTSNTINTNNYNLAKQQNLDTKEHSLEALDVGKNTSKLMKNIQLTTASGNSQIDMNGLRGLDFKLKTLSKDKISIIGDQFLRYGYMYDGSIDFTDFNLMKYFTYWKAKEVWLTADNVYEKAKTGIKNILLKGTTVWGDPNNIGAPPDDNIPWENEEPINPGQFDPYGTLTYTEDGVKKTFVVYTYNNVEKLSCNKVSSTINFENGPMVPIENVIGWEFNLSGHPVYKGIHYGFLGNAVNLNCDIVIPDWIDSLSGAFLCNCTNFNGIITLNDNLDRIGHMFLYGCTNFNKPIVLPNGLTSIGASFLAHTNFNQNITIPESCDDIGSLFLAGCQEFNSSITMPTNINVGSILETVLPSYSPLNYNNVFTLTSGMKIENGSFQKIKGNTIFVCEANPENIGYEIISGGSVSTRMFTCNYDDLNADIIFTGTYKNEMAEKFPSFSNVYNGIKRNTVVL